MLVLRPTFPCLGKLGNNRIFDRAWTIASLLLMGLLALLFSFDFWVAEIIYILTEMELV